MTSCNFNKDYETTCTTYSVEVGIFSIVLILHDINSSVFKIPKRMQYRQFFIWVSFPRNFKYIMKMINQSQ